jgi:hypothetical protein
VLVSLPVEVDETATAPTELMLPPLEVPVVVAVAVVE